MKSLSKLVLALLMAVAVISISALAQNKKPGGARSRGIEIAEDYNTGKADGMIIVIQKEVSNRLVEALPMDVFKSGERFKLEFESNFDGFVYIVNVTPKGKTCLIFPHPSESNNAIIARKRYTLPQQHMFRFNEEKGTEVLHLYMSREPIPLFEETLRNAIAQGEKNACMGDSAAAAAKELANTTPKKAAKSSSSGADTKALEPILAQQSEKSGNRSRGIRYFSGETNNKKESTIAIDSKNGDGHLKKGEYAFKEIRLEHR